MDWTRRHDTLLFREILVVNPFQAKKKTTQRAELWQSIANNLKKSEDPHFKETLAIYIILCYAKNKRKE